VDLICVGDVMLDVRVEAGALARGGDVHGTVRVQPGGSSANAAVWGAWSGATTMVIAAVGMDFAGQLLVRALEEHGVDWTEIRWIERPTVPTGTMLVVHEAGERSMVADRGANAELVPASIPEAFDAGSVLVSGYLLLQEPGTETALAAFEAARSQLVAIEAASWPLLASFGKDRFFESTSGVHAILANEREAEVLTGSEPVGAARALSERYRLACVKRGAQGAVMVLDGTEHRAVAEPVVDRDPTGAGDAFDGVLLATLALGSTPDEALAEACRAGALVAGSASTWPEGPS
jgi:ribokinase